MNALSKFLASIPVDKWLHLIGSVVIFMVVHYATGNVLLAIELAVAAHVVKKILDVLTKRLDLAVASGRADFIGDIAFGVIGALLAAGCTFVR